MPVFGVLKRNGKVYVQIIKNAEKSTLLPIIKQIIKRNPPSTRTSGEVMTDLFLTVTSTIGSIIPKSIPTEEEPISTALKIFGASPKKTGQIQRCFQKNFSASFERMRIPLQS